MKLRKTWIAIFTILSAFATYAGEQESATFKGEISDSQCALNVHSLTKSHEEMLKSKSGAAGHNAATCSIYCITQLGGKFVLTSKGHVFHLDNQDLPRRFVGEKVKVRGTLDAKGDSIHVVSIDAQ
ncbi:MAG: DUF5818 domain-containing protein [Terriglobales bacterium]|jgi:hypothetical protein